MSIQFNTDSVAPKERSAYWQEVVCNTFVPLECQLSAPEEFQGSIQACRLGDLSLVDVNAHQQTVVRDTRSIGYSDDEYMLVSLAREGRSRVTQEGREANLEAGDFAIYDTRRPYRLLFDGAFRQTVVQIPRASLQRRVGHLEYLTALPMSRNNPLDRMVFDFLLGLAALENQLSASQQVRLSEQGLDLLAMALSQRAEGQATQGSRRTALLFRIKDYVHAHLSNPDLTLTEVSTRFSISPRYISSLFQQEQTSFSRYLLESRLKHCARDLREPMLANRQISEIAYRWGFGDMAYFSRVFRTHFGQPAREFRRG
ncbi:helix-turn-helix domain-containing protein [Pseudomonas chlororaphis]|uniref:AraC-like ligand-binding domain-containing protein n=1 Tax=Pseudomonas chlororaphis TaxID=587753 RepID=UPI0004707DE5|nr:helix-turn-helix domain-containing protein [Pseudomonas chlororaphis]